MSPTENTAPPEQALALNYARPELRKPLDLFFRFDDRLARVVLLATEPLPAQLRLAWWREQFAKPVADRPHGEPMLEEMGRDWPGCERYCLALVDGWELLLQEFPLEKGALDEFAAGRAAPFASMQTDPAYSTATELCGKIWALADLAAKLSDGDLKREVVGEGRVLLGNMPTLPRDMRFLTVLAGLGRRALVKGGAPLLADRASVAVALRLGLLGR
ncbi:15-cis-phytoene synthase [Alteripontixanthobacter maritimus]|uniref:15-cis-phytoene synthase n=1 Tax=Alteripontixanthobacter maritimus TaxID=2161824 RepID=A0A369Q683_9SPHN|nr:hypothetical protein [Alteripontixanthobacter maritimus]RDC59992.1 15-cis-phytoene synthase [Alteripontixanthobacter maritimus]